MEELLRQGIAAAKAGQRRRAYELLMQVVQSDGENVTAWLWLSGVVDGLEEREVCLENVLALDPANEAARKGLEWVRRQKAGSAPAPGETQPSPAPEQAIQPPTPVRARAGKPVSTAAAMLREDYARRQPPLQPEPPPPPPRRDEFEDEYQCPYCAALTAPGDRKCPTCGNPLWIAFRRRERRSSWLWVALTLQAASTIWPTIIPLLMLFYAAYRAGIDNFFSLVPLYLGLPNEVPPQAAAVALATVPRLYVLPFAFYLLFSLVVFVGLGLRWKPVYFLFAASALLTLGSALGGMVIALGLPREALILSPRIGVACSGSGLIWALFMFLLALRIEDDFFFDETRLLLRRDRDATNGPALLESGQRYARRGMWAMAALHLSRAAALMPQRIETHLSLSAAYLNLKRYDLAAGALDEARRIDPHDPQMRHLESLLAERHAGQQ